MDNMNNFQRGDWIVHKHYGVGQIRAVEEKAISGEPTPYYRVKSEKSTFWVPVEDSDKDEYLRPIATADECQQVLDILSRPAHEMHDNFRMRQGRIRDVERSDSLLAVARLVRDLYVRGAELKLNGTEQRALRDLRERLLAEWSTSMGMDKSEAKRQLTNLLRQNCAEEEEEEEELAAV